MKALRITVNIVKPELNIYDEIERCLEVYKITPAIEINNVEGNQTTIQLANHRIKWLDSSNETKIQIDQDLFTLKNKITLNLVSGNKDSVDFSNNWEEVKLYRYHNQEYIGIRMWYSPCNGLGCSVHYYLIYDVATKSKNFFGSFIHDGDLELFDFSNDLRVDYVSCSHKGDPYGSIPTEFILELYSMNSDGRFTIAKDNDGISYQIVHTTFPNEPTKADKYREHWVTKIITEKI